MAARALTNENADGGPAQGERTLAPRRRFQAYARVSVLGTAAVSWVRRTLWWLHCWGRAAGGALRVKSSTVGAPAQEVDGSGAGGRLRELALQALAKDLLLMSWD